jgi:S1-C subfamily serine protease
MRSNIKIILVLVLFLFAVGFTLRAEPAPGDDDKELQEITQNVFPSVVRVEARNLTKKMATGVVIDKDGYIVTTALVSPHEEEIFVVTSQGKRVEAEFLGLDPVTHLALIQANDKHLPPIEKGKIEDLTPGAWIGVISISPENTPAVTQGIISSFSPIFPYNLRLNVWVFPGSSGSPIVDREGRLVGMLRGVYAEEKPVVFEFREKELVGSGYVVSRAEAPSSGIALAVPVNILGEVCTEIRKKGKVERGWLGVSIAENQDGQVEVVNVEKESPAEMAELKRGDVILEFDGKKISSTQMLVNEVRKRKPGDSVEMKTERKGKEKKIKVKLGEYSKKSIKRELELKFPQLFPPQPPKAPAPPKAKITERPFLEAFPRTWESRKYIGVYLEELNRELSAFFGVKEGIGLIVSKVSEDSPADKAGLQVGDVIVKADGERVESVRELSELVQDKEKGDTVEIEFFRDKKRKSIKVEIEEEEKSQYFSFGRSYEDYQDILDEYNSSLEKNYKNIQEMYQKDFKKNMKKLNQDLKKIYEKVSEKSGEAANDLMRMLKKYRGVKV